MKWIEWNLIWEKIIWNFKLTLATKTEHIMAFKFLKKLSLSFAILPKSASSQPQTARLPGLRQASDRTARDPREVGADVRRRRDLHADALRALGGAGEAGASWKEKKGKRGENQKFVSRGVLEGKKTHRKRLSRVCWKLFGCCWIKEISPKNIPNSADVSKVSIIGFCRGPWWEPYIWNLTENMEFRDLIKNWSGTLERNTSGNLYREPDWDKPIWNLCGPISGLIGVLVKINLEPFWGTLSGHKLVAAFRTWIGNPGTSHPAPYIQNLIENSGKQLIVTGNPIDDPICNPVGNPIRNPTLSTTLSQSLPPFGRVLGTLSKT